MAQITTVSVGSSGWTRVDSLASHTYIEVRPRPDGIGFGVRISGSDPGAGVSWDAAGGRVIDPRDSWPMRLGTTDQVWMRAESGTNHLVDVSEAL